MKAECPYCNKYLVPTKSWARFGNWFHVAFGVCTNLNCDGLNNWFGRTKSGDVYAIPSIEEVELIPFRIKEFANKRVD